MRKLMTVAVAAGLFVGGAGVAVADGWERIPKLQTKGAEFGSAAYTWEPRGRNHGGFHFNGELADLNVKDGHNVSVEVKVNGYGWNTFKGVQNKRISLDKVVYDGAAQLTTDAWIRLCRDRGSLRPDNCSVTRHYQRG
ncbi:hypothetical protein ABZ957_10855 [Streptomyces sp. NPDC046316]|uniref:hypothetical protein n=1 Tax=Streptomyces sp. NPDC046316 TaxID=3154494 RepID=UPI0033EA403C